MKSNLLKSARVKHGMTQEQVAKVLGIDKTTYSKKEKGKNLFKINEIQILVSIFKLSKEELFEIFFTDNVDFKSTLPS